MNVLQGTFSVMMDGYGRIVLPVHLRKALLDESLFITRSNEKCLMVWRRGDVPKKLEYFYDMSLPNKQKRALERFYIGAGQTVIPDKRGRIIIPEHLRKHAGLVPGSPVLVVGCNEYIELWDQATFEDISDEYDDLISSILHPNDL